MAAAGAAVKSGKGIEAVKLHAFSFATYAPGADSAWKPLHDMLAILGKSSAPNRVVAVSFAAQSRRFLYDIVNCLL
eukprot:tig00000507_g1768.t1